MADMSVIGTRGRPDSASRPYRRRSAPQADSAGAGAGGYDAAPHPVRVCVLWDLSGRVDVYEPDVDLPAARALARALSGCTDAIRRAWVESADGALLYVAVAGHGLAPRFQQGGER